MNEIRKKISKVTYDRNKGILHFELLDKKFQLGPSTVCLIQKILEGKINNGQHGIPDTREKEPTMIFQMTLLREGNTISMDIFRRENKDIIEQYYIGCNVLAEAMGIKESLYQQENSPPLLFFKLVNIRELEKVRNARNRAF